MADPQYSSPALSAYAAGFETSPQPTVAVAGEPLRVVLLNAAARTVFGDATGRALPDVVPRLGTAVREACARVADTGRAERLTWRVAGVAEDPLLDAMEVVVSPAALAVPAVKAAPGPVHDGALVLLHFVNPAAVPQEAETVPVLPGADVSVASVSSPEPGGPHAGWWDVVPSGDHGVALVVGNVVGGGRSAAAAIAALRAVLRERLGDGRDVGAAVAATERLGRGLPGARGATACVVLVDLRSGTMTYCTCGHPPPLVLDGDRSAAYLEPTGSGPLGSGIGVRTARAALGPDHSVLLHTGGVLGHGPERAQRGRELAEVALRSRRSDPSARDWSGRWVNTLMVDLLGAPAPDGPGGDDIALVGLRRVPSVPALGLHLEPVATTPRLVRRELGAWLERLGVRDEDQFAIQHAVGELVTNAVLHPRHRAGQRATITVNAEVAAGRVAVSVLDPGPWRDGRPSQRAGSGLALARQLADRLDVVPGVDGTRVTAWLPVGRGVLHLSAPGVGTGRHVADELVVEPAGASTLRVVGAVDLVSCENLLRFVLVRSLGGTVPVTVDLSGVTLLASAGVRTLAELVGWSVGGARTVELLAAPGTCAEQVLAASGLPYRTA